MTADEFLEKTLLWYPSKANSIFAPIPAEWIGREIDYIFNNGAEHQLGHRFNNQPVIQIITRNARQHDGRIIRISCIPCLVKIINFLLFYSFSIISYTLKLVFMYSITVNYYLFYIILEWLLLF